MYRLKCFNNVCTNMYITNLMNRLTHLFKLLLYITDKFKTDFRNKQLFPVQDTYI